MKHIRVTMPDGSEWSEVCHLAVRHKEPEAVDFEEGWCNGEKEVVDK